MLSKDLEKKSVLRQNAECKAEMTILKMHVNADAVVCPRFGGSQIDDVGSRRGRRTLDKIVHTL